MKGNRVVVTGLGAVTPLGLDVASTWAGICAGKSGAAMIDQFDAKGFSTQFSASVKNFSVEGYLEARDARRMDPFIQYGMVAGIQAFRDSGVAVTDENATRIGCAIGSGIGGIGSIEDTAMLVDRKGPKRISPFFVPGAIINMIAGNLSIMYNLQGPNLAVVTACTTGTHNIGLGARLIAAGDVDAMLVGGAEMATTPVGVGGFAAARALSTRNDDPERASRPWDEGRDGFVLGDGAGVLMLESLDVAVARGARIYCEVTGFGMSGDAYHMTSPPEDGRGAAAAMRQALKDAEIAPEDVAYINAHGTSTEAGDFAESQAITTVFGSHAHSLAVSSTKSMIGHLLGAAGSVEAILTILALRDNVAPPTINLDKPSPGCDLNYVPHTAQERVMQHALSNSFGFGGTNGSLIFSRMT
ncbi:MAG: beta-ketoacyl-ACP synthase II [Luminiphilus sp.]|jgi:3-oxoacyl-[acyl-carrier-protein] synthase II|nr:beta-ketoacyl-ACP synthase II [Luminiphilus sp.]MBT6352506.1 beta-ketoacyl-ACP synthase II [Halieaceae bacterium]MBL6897459.1 beta-ketoacyl-ACP synthase II [Luminiphilus sp.]MDA8619527.1 beta-ketoacyl-ACP synthase II [Luminiphilus sp.]MDB2364521.1 beta-ketoacyl-ACP synthase II [Luminiphilus sp.]